MRSNQFYRIRPNSRSPGHSRRRLLVWMGLITLVAITFTIGLARAQQAVTYSINYSSPTIATPDSLWGLPITEGDILGPLPPMAPGPPPMIVISGGMPNGLGLPMHGAAVGHPAGAPGFVEVDALSFGRDTPVGQAEIFPITWVFSVDEFAIGMQPPPAAPPNVSTEGSVLFPAPPPPGQEASADLFSYFPPGALPPGVYPIPVPIPFPPGNIDLLDGDGLGPIGPFSLGLNFEPNMPFMGPIDNGDNLDAVDLETHFIGDFPLFPVYYSLDSQIVPDWIEGMLGTGSAGANGGYVGGDVLVTMAPGAPPVVYAPALLLGLDILGSDSDDLDALILWDNGDGIFQPPTDWYSWLFAAPTDMLFFSVRRGSLVIGMPDSNFGVPISEGDILMPPLVAGGTPGIWVPAEILGLCTIRSGPCPVMPWNPVGLVTNDDLNAMDVAPDCDDDGIPDVIWIMMGGGPPVDCNQNGIPDACDIANGTSQDCQPNGIPDECDIDATDPDGDGLVSPDCNFNGVPDECDYANGCLHDADGDGTADECECTSDTNRDGSVDVLDLIKLLAEWGACP